jgi:hypothetical protein
MKGPTTWVRFDECYTVAIVPHKALLLSIAVFTDRSVLQELNPRCWRVIDV